MVDHPQLCRMQHLDITTPTELLPLCHIQVIIIPDLQQKDLSHSPQHSVNKSLKRYFRETKQSLAVLFQEQFKMLVQVNLPVQ